MSAAGAALVAALACTLTLTHPLACFLPCILLSHACRLRRPSERVREREALTATPHHRSSCCCLAAAAAVTVSALDCAGLASPFLTRSLARRLRFLSRLRVTRGPHLVLFPRSRSRADLLTPRRGKRNRRRSRQEPPNDEIATTEEERQEPLREPWVDPFSSTWAAVASSPATVATPS